jgi:hypothetical protein
MNRHTLTDARYRTIGHIDTASDGKQTGRDARYHVVGYYDPRTDITRDARQHMVGQGNLLVALLGMG